MNSFKIAQALLVFAVCAQVASGGAAEKTRILMVTQSKGFQHKPVKRMERDISPAELAMRQLGVKSGLFHLDWTQDAAADFTRENLQNYDIVMFFFRCPGLGLAARGSLGSGGRCTGYTCCRG